LGHAWTRAQNLRGEAATAVETFVYYVEFRAARNGVYGHSYIAHGCLDGNGLPATARFADVHPNGGFASMVLGHFVPIRATTEPADETLQHTITSAYRRTLSVPEYQELIAAIARVRAAVRWWNVFGYNCNDFVAEVARAIGLRTPATLMRPYEFIPALHRMNEPVRSSIPDRRAPAGLPQVVSIR
jgi:hypothetical protein